MTTMKFTAAEMIYFAAVERDDFTAQTIAAKFASQCVFCEKAIVVGEQIVSDPTFTPLGWMHEGCRRAMLALDERLDDA